MTNSEIEEMVEVSEALIDAVEGIKGASEYGTFWSDRGIRFKDTEEWVDFYVCYNKIVNKGVDNE